MGGSVPGVDVRPVNQGVILFVFPFFVSFFVFVFPSFVFFADILTFFTISVEALPDSML